MTAPSELWSTPPVYSLPVSLGADILIDFMNQSPGSDPPEYVDWPAGWTVTLQIGKAGSYVTAPADISGYHAVCRISSAISDGLKAGTPWACIVAVPDADGTDTDHIAAINGAVVRADGY